MRRNPLYLIAIFCIYLVIDISIVHAFSITHNPATDVTPTDRTADVRWTTDDSSDSRVNYGATNALGSSEADPANTTSHSVTVSGLTPGTLYYYSLASMNGSGATATANNNGNFYTFRTAADTTPPFINTSLPAYHNSNWIGFTGVTEPDSIIKAYVNRPSSDVGTLNYDNIASSDSSGIFVFSRVSLPLDANNIVLWAQDLAGNTNTAAYTIEIDAVPPNITLVITSADSGLNFTLKELPSLSPVSSLTAKGTASEAVNITYTVNNNTQTLSTDRDFEFTLMLDETMENFVSIVFADKGNNIVRYENTIKVDAEGPKIVRTNLGDLDPSYVQNIKITGNASKPNVDIIVYVNNLTRSSDAWSTSFLDTVKHYGGLAIGAYEESYTTKTDKYGKFELTVFLTQDITSNTDEWDLTQGSDIPSPQPVTVPGQTATGEWGGETGKAYGIPSVWDNMIRIVAVDDFKRSDEVEGNVRFAKCGIGGDWDIDTSQVTPSVITPDHLNKEGLAELSFSGTLKWQGPGEDTEALEPGKKRPTVESLAVRTYELNKEITKKYAIDPKELVGGVNSMLDPVTKRSFYVSIPLHKVNYTQKEWKELKERLDKEDISIIIPLEIEINYFYEDAQGNIVRKVQRQCIDIRTILDIKIPPEVIPKWLLEDSIKFIDDTIKAIDSILEPLKKITLVVFITCLLSWVVYFVMLVQQKFICKSSGEGSSSEDSGQCADAKNKLEKTKIAMHWICDRVFCPKVPMINKYIKETGVPGGDKDGKCSSERSNDLGYINNLEGKPTLSFNPESESEQPSCGQSYMNDWDSACVGITNELDESKCLVGTETGNEEILGDQACTGSLKRLLRTVSLSNLCKGKSKEGNIDYVEGEDYTVCKDENKDWHYCSSRKTGSNTKGGIEGLQTYAEPSSKCPGTVGAYNDRIVYAANADNVNSMTGENERITATIEEEGRDTTLYSANCEGLVANANRDDECAVDSEGRAYIVTSEGVGGLEGTKVKPAYATCGGENKGTYAPPEMRSDYHNLQRQYLVNPTEGLITSVRCVCLPAINGHLILWRNILAQVKTCLETILVTGDGSPGVCKAVLSMYVCDVIFKAIRCFTQMFGGGGKEADTGKFGSMEGFMKAVAGAGRDIQSEITGRYGETGLYNTMFNEKKLMTAICLFAFTGDFDFDIEGLLTGGAAVPLGSKVFIYPHDRRFMGSNPLNKGYATWIYHIGIGIAAGSDISYHVYLVCSATNECNPSEGFLGGKCDCAGKGEQIYDITHEVGGGFLKVGEMVGPNDGDVYVKIKDHAVRYNKVRVVWTPGPGVKGVEGGTKEEPITQIGDKPPLECTFDLLGAEFRCGFAIGDLGYAAFTGQPVLSKTEPYKIGDAISMTASVDKRSPNYDPNVPEKSNPNNQIPFFLIYWIADGSNKITEGKVQIIQDGTSSYTVPEGGGFQVKEEDIMGYFVGGTYKVSDISVKVFTSLQAAVTRYPDPRVFSDFYVKFTQAVADSDEPRDIISRAVVCEGQIQTVQNNMEFKEGSSCDNKLASALVSSDKKRLIVEYKGVQVDVPFYKEISQDTGFVVDYTAPQTTTTKPCDETYDMTKPKEWKFNIGLYRCSRVDESKPYSNTNCANTPSNEPVEYYGRQQHYELPLKVVCSEKAKLGTCMNDMLLSEPCMCGDEEAAKGKFCHTDYTNNIREAFDYKACTLNLKVVDETSVVKIGDRYYCGCRSDGSVEDCTNKACSQNVQGLLGCW